jgi:hypothetical protein
VDVLAHHECGHAVVHQYFRHPIEEIEIAESGEGHCSAGASGLDDPLDAEHNRDRIDRQCQLEYAMACMAGKATMDKWFGWKAKNDQNWRGSEDYKQAFDCALQLNDGDRAGAELLMKWLERRTELLVEKQWAQIQKLASALQEKQKFTGNGRFSGAEIKELLG